MKRAIKTYAREAVAIIVIFALAIFVGGYILNHQRFRFPLIQSSPFSINAELSTAQAVLPGQGQSVRVSGVQIGEVGGVLLKDGKAIVRLDLQPQYRHLIHTDSTALLRPRTGLKDMFLEVNPGRAPASVVGSGFTIPVSNTLPDVNPDEILASLDGDTRAYLELLINGGGQGLNGNGGTELGQVLQRFLPTHQDLARLNRATALRGANLRRVVNSLQRLNTALAGEQGQLVQIVTSSSRVFRAFASEGGNVSRAVADLPATLRQATATLGDVQAFAGQLGPAARNLLPAAGSLPAANRALAALATPSAPIVQNQIRPFVVASRPLVRNLRPAAINLAAATPNLSTVFTVLNHLFNLLGYYPGGAQHGYLWWLAWGQHAARTLFSNQNADGDFRPVFLQADCPNLKRIAATNGGSTGALAGFSSIIAKYCPKGP